MSHPIPTAPGRQRSLRAPLLLVVLVAGAVFGSAVGAFAAATFTDVGPTHPFAHEIEWLSDRGISTGWPDGTFRPTEPVTRQAMSAFMYRLAGADPTVAPMVNAATLQGRSVADLTPPDRLWAVVEPGGAVARGRGAVSASSPVQDGWYEVVFDRDVSACAYQATLGLSAPGSLQPGMIAVAPRIMQPRAVWVQTFDLDGVDAPRSFHLEVTC